MASERGSRSPSQQSTGPADEQQRAGASPSRSKVSLLDLDQLMAPIDDPVTASVHHPTASQPPTVKLSSPRSLEACQACGVDPDVDLRRFSLHYFMRMKERGAQQLAWHRFERHKRQRDELMAKLQRVRRQLAEVGSPDSNEPMQLDGPEHPVVQIQREVENANRRSTPARSSSAGCSQFRERPELLEARKAAEQRRREVDARRAKLNEAQENAAQTKRLLQQQRDLDAHMRRQQQAERMAFLWATGQEPASAKSSPREVLRSPSGSTQMQSQRSEEVDGRDDDLDQPFRSGSRGNAASPPRVALHHAYSKQRQSQVKWRKELLDAAHEEQVAATQSRINHSIRDAKRRRALHHVVRFSDSSRGGHVKNGGGAMSNEERAERAALRREQLAAMEEQRRTQQGRGYVRHASEPNRHRDPAIEEHTAEVRNRRATIQSMTCEMRAEAAEQRATRVEHLSQQRAMAALQRFHKRQSGMGAPTPEAARRETLQRFHLQQLAQAEVHQADARARRAAALDHERLLAEEVKREREEERRVNARRNRLAAEYLAKKRRMADS